MTQSDIDRAKKELRQHCLQKRQTMDHAQHRLEQTYIDKEMQSLVCAEQQRPVVAYAAMADECSCDALCRSLWQEQRTVYLPKVVAPHVLSWHAVSSASELEAGSCGIREPTTAATMLPSDCIIFIPGLAFTRRGQRLGMGGGFYDGVLEGLTDTALSVGVAWSCQILQNLPMDDHDQSVGRVISPS